MDDTVVDRETGVLGRVATVNPDGTGRVEWQDGRVESRPLSLLEPVPVRERDPGRSFGADRGAGPARMDDAVARGEAGRPRTAAERMRDAVAAGAVVGRDRQRALDVARGERPRPTSAEIDDQIRDAAGASGGGTVEHDYSAFLRQAGVGDSELSEHHRATLQEIADRWNEGTPGTVLARDLRADGDPLLARIAKGVESPDLLRGSPAAPKPVRKSAARKMAAPKAQPDIKAIRRQIFTASTREEVDALTEGLTVAQLRELQVEMGMVPVGRTKPEIRRHIAQIATAEQQAAGLGRDTPALELPGGPAGADLPSGADIEVVASTRDLSPQHIAQAHHLTSAGQRALDALGPPGHERIAAIPDTEGKIREAYRMLAIPGGGVDHYVALEDLRKLIGDQIPRADLDAELVRLNRTHDVRLVPQSYARSNAATRIPAAVQFGGQEMDQIHIDDPTLNRPQQFAAVEMADELDARRAGRPGDPQMALISDADLQGEIEARAARDPFVARQLAARTSATPATPAPPRTAEQQAAGLGRDTPSMALPEPSAQTDTGGRISRSDAARIMFGDQPAPGAAARRMAGGRAARPTRDHILLANDASGLARAGESEQNIKAWLTRSSDARVLGAGRAFGLDLTGLDKVTAAGRIAAHVVEHRPARIDPGVDPTRRLAEQISGMADADEASIVAALQGLTGPKLRTVANEIGAKIPTTMKDPAEIRAFIARSLRAFGHSGGTLDVPFVSSSSPAVARMTGRRPAGPKPLTHGQHDDLAAIASGRALLGEGSRAEPLRRDGLIEPIPGQPGRWQITAAGQQALSERAPRQARFDAGRVAEEVAGLASSEEIQAALAGRNAAELRRLATALNLPVPATLRTGEAIAAYIAENVIRDRSRWSLR